MSSYETNLITKLFGNLASHLKMDFNRIFYIAPIQLSIFTKYFHKTFKFMSIKCYLLIFFCIRTLVRIAPLCEHSQV